METKKYIKTFFKIVTIGILITMLIGCTPQVCPTYADNSNTYIVNTI